MSLWGRVRSLFRPRVLALPSASIYEGDPDQARLERPRQALSRTRWLQSDIERAILLADQGDLSLAGSLSQALRRDGVFAGLLSTRAGGLTRLPRIFRGTSAVIAELDRPDDVGLFDRVFSPKELELFVADGIVLGVAVGELIYLPGQDEPVFVRLDPQYLRYRWAEDRWYYQSAEGLLPITPGDGRWLLHTPGGILQPWQFALWPSMGRGFVAKEHAYLYRENYSGKLANPARVAISPLGTTDAQKESFFKRVMAWGVNTVFGLLPGWDVKLLESNGRGYEVFSKTIEDADREFAVGLAGQVVTVDGGAGFANANIHATIRSDLIQGDGMGLASTINAQGLRPVINRLFGCGATGTIQWDTRPPADLAAEANAIRAAADAITTTNAALATYGLRVDAREIVARFKIPTYPLELSSADGDGPDTDALVDELASKMTDYQIARCEHGSSNRCRLCGVERVRDFVVNADGSHTWRVLWRPIAKAKPSTPSPLALVSEAA
ncbi:MAG: DUF935 family protein [Polyangiaceae bacterium]|nr:DUF935 family protein [Polyangiaceae bacterium]